MTSSLTSGRCSVSSSGIPTGSSVRSASRTPTQLPVCSTPQGRPPPATRNSSPWCLAPFDTPSRHHGRMMLNTLRRVATDLRGVLAEYEPERMTGSDAATLLEAFSEIEKLAAGGKLLSARRVESSNVWRKQGHRSAAAHVAEATGSGLGPAINALKAARCLGSLPATDDAMRNGRLSETQVKEIAGAAMIQPDAEQELVDAANK